MRILPFILLLTMHCVQAQQLSPPEEKKFTAEQLRTDFDGQVYVLTNGGSFSMSGYTSAFLKHRVNATVIGQETGGAEEGSRAILSHELVLPHTQVIVFIPYFNLDHQLPAASYGRGVIPQIPITYSVEDRLQNKDKELETLLKTVTR